MGRRSRTIERKCVMQKQRRRQAGRQSAVRADEATSKRQACLWIVSQCAGCFCKWDPWFPVVPISRGERLSIWRLQSVKAAARMVGDQKSRLNARRAKSASFCQSLLAAVVE